MAKKAKLGKRLRKGVKTVVASDIARGVVEKLVTAALLAAAAKLTESAAETKTAKAAKKAVTGKKKTKKRKS